MIRLLTTLVCSLLILTVAAIAQADTPRALAAGKLPGDVRLNPPKDLGGYFPLAVPKTPAEWEARAEQVRRQVLVSQGLWPLPERTPLNAVVHGLIDQGDYTVEKVYFESLPGFFVTGNLYRPKNRDAKSPGVLSPHGHWADGRFHDAGRQKTRQEIVKGAERFENGGRSPLQARQVQLARMGCTVFHYDMLGYADCTQLSFELVHRFAKQRPEMNNPENWGLYSPPAEANLQSVMGLQTWNSIRALDFLLSLPQVDASRIAVSGASGGGTQTFLLAAVDPRVTLAFPAVMVSTGMQGGCTCENASCLRVETGNIELAGLFAPRPQGMTGAKDWTQEMETKGFPELKALYGLLGAPKSVELFPFVHFPHNYNYVSRSAFYGFVNKHFKLGIEKPVVEEDYPRLTREEMTVWDVTHPQPKGGDEFERKLTRHLRDDAQKQLAALQPKDAGSLAKWREVVGGGIAMILGRGLPAAKDLEFERTEETDLGDYFRFAGLLKNKSRGEELPMAFLHPKKWNKRVVLVIAERGKSVIFDDEGGPAMKDLLDAGVSIAGVDLFQQGEFLTEPMPVRNRSVANTREFAGFTYGYNHALVAQRAHDVLSAIAFIKTHEEDKPESVDLVALDDMSPAAILALSQAGGAVRKAAIDTHGFRFGKVADYLDAKFLPGGAKYGDVPGMLSLAAPAKLWLAGETAESAAVVKAAYGASGSQDGLKVTAGKPEDQLVELREWLVK